MHDPVTLTPYKLTEFSERPVSTAPLFSTSQGVRPSHLWEKYVTKKKTIKKKLPPHLTFMLHCPRAAHALLARTKMQLNQQSIIWHNIRCLHQNFQQYGFELSWDSHCCCFWYVLTSGQLMVGEPDGLLAPWLVVWIWGGGPWYWMWNMSWGGLTL